MNNQTINLSKRLLCRYYDLSQFKSRYLFLIRSLIFSSALYSIVLNSISSSALFYFIKYIKRASLLLYQYNLTQNFFIIIIPQTIYPTNYALRITLTEYSHNLGHPSRCQDFTSLFLELSLLTLIKFKAFSIFTKTL